MRRHRRLVALGGLLAAFVFVGVSVLPAAAATSETSIGGSGNGLKVSPVTTDVTISPGQTKTVLVYAQNITSTPLTLQVLVNDFTASGDESGTPSLLLNPGQYAPAHSLKRYVAPIGNITLKPGEQKGVSVVVTIPRDAPGGGYYGAVRFAPTSTNTNSTVTLSASVASLVLVRVPGNVKEDMQLLSLGVNQGNGGASQAVFTSNKKLIATMRFQNVGDVQEQPFGKLLLKQGSKVLATYEINDSTPPGNVLPGSVRRFTVNLDKVGTFGKYTVVGNFGYGSNGQLLSGQTTFYVIPIALIVTVVLAVLVVLSFVFILPRMIQAYNKRIIRKASRR